MDLQELISRGRFIFSGAPERLKLYSLVDGRRTARDLAETTRRQITNVHKNLRQLADIGLLQERRKDGEVQRKGGFTLYEKTPLARTVPLSYFKGLTKIHRSEAAPNSNVSSERKPRRSLGLPAENEILDMCKKGEDQTLEFKSAGTDVRKVTKEIAAMSNTREGGIILYGVDDEGTIHGSDVKRQKFDQPLQNSIKNSIAPALTVSLKTVSVIGSELLVIIVPPWNRRDVYQFDEKVLIRKGTNTFAAKPEELRKLHKGQPVV